MINRLQILFVTVAILIAACSTKKPDPTKADNVITPANQQVKLPAPYQTKATWNFCRVIGWPKGKTPMPPAGFKVNLYADSLDNPRNMFVAANGDIFVSQAIRKLTV